MRYTKESWTALSPVKATAFIAYEVHVTLDIDPCKRSSDAEQCAFSRGVLQFLRADQLWSRLQKSFI